MSVPISFETNLLPTKGFAHVVQSDPNSKQSSLLSSSQPEGDFKYINYIG